MEKRRPNPPGKEWTIMIYCAGDNDLAPLIVSQLKLLKDAGRHKDVNVLAYFDPSEKGVPTRLYRLNQYVAFLQRSALDSYVPNMKDDNIDLSRFSSAAARKFRRAMALPDKVEAFDALSLFLNFCKKHYPAEHYVLVLMGHGMIVANDAFLPDESPLSAISLNQLGGALKEFDHKLDLIAMHSCSMSAVEVAYELQDKAKYMIASEGLAFVGSLPYRHLLLRLYSLLNGPDGDGTTAPQKIDARDLVERLYKLSSHNGLDFMLSGYSQDLALINLDDKKLKPLTKALRTLVKELINGLQESETAKQFIQLAHLESQSFFEENYTDLYDFCLCLERKCNRKLKGLRDACREVRRVLEPNSDANEIDDRFDRIVIHSRNFGWQYQHSHGLSIYFPWSWPLGDVQKSVLTRYEEYAFTAALGERNTWLEFLDRYLTLTERERRQKDLSFDAAGNNEFGWGFLHKPSAAMHKPSGASGVSCSCPSIKNFPTEDRAVTGRERTRHLFAMSRKLGQKDAPDEDPVVSD